MSSTPDVHTLAARVADRDNCNPICPDCGYRMSAIDITRSACRHCGQIMSDPRRVVAHVLNMFNGRLSEGLF